MKPVQEQLERASDILQALLTGSIPEPERHSELARANLIIANTITYISEQPGATTMPDPFVHVPRSILNGAITVLREESHRQGIDALETIVTQYTRREPGPGMTEVRAHALYEAVNAYGQDRALAPSVVETQWDRVEHILKVIKKGGSL